jgi:hypothetical protein
MSLWYGRLRLALLLLVPLCWFGEINEVLIDRLGDFKGKWQMSTEKKSLD